MMPTLYTIKPPEWRLHGLWWIADTIVGQLAVHDLKHNWDAPNSVGSADSLEDGKALATTHYEKAMAAGLVEHVCEWRKEGDGYRASCGFYNDSTHYALFNEDPQLHGYKGHCGYCGGRITEGDDAKN